MRLDTMQTVAVVLSDSEDEGELHSEESQNNSDDVSSEEGEIQSDVDDNDLDEDDAFPTEETPWERGLRLARERLRRAKILRQTDEDLEEKKLKLAVVAPEANDDDLSAVDNERLHFTDPLWTNYYKLAIIGRTQLTGKRTLPWDLDPPTDSKISHWRRSLVPVGARRGLVHTHRSVSISTDGESSSLSGGQSRASSLSSIAGSILLAVPELAADDESDRDIRRRHSSVSSSSSSADSSSSSIVRKQRKTPSRRKKRFASSSASRSSSSSSSSYSRHRSRSPKERADGRKTANVAKQYPNSSGVPSRGRRPLAYLENQRQQPAIQTGQPSANAEERGEDKSISKHMQYTSGDRENENRNVGTDPRWAQRPSNIISQNFDGSRSPAKPTQAFTHSDKPISSWVSDPSNRTKQPLDSSNKQAARISKQNASTAVRSRSSSLNEEKTTFITSWSQASSPNDDEPQRNQIPRSRRQILPDVVPNSASAASKKRGPSDQRRKSRSPFADTVYGGTKPPGIRSHGKNRKPQPPPVSDIHPPFEQSVPLLAGAVNPGNPSSMLSSIVSDSVSLEKTALVDKPMNELPAASARPGVKLKIAPRLKVPVLPPGSGLGKSLPRHISISEYMSPAEKSQNPNLKQKYKERIPAQVRPRRPFKRTVTKATLDSDTQSQSSSRSTSSSPRSDSRSPQTDSSLSEHMPEQFTNRHRQLAQESFIQSRPAPKRIRSKYTTVSPDEFPFPPTKDARENRMNSLQKQQYEEPANYKMIKRSRQKDARKMVRGPVEPESQAGDLSVRGKRAPTYGQASFGQTNVNKKGRLQQFAERREDNFAPDIPLEDVHQYSERPARSDRLPRSDMEDRRVRGTNLAVQDRRGVDLIQKQALYNDRTKNTRNQVGQSDSLYQLGGAQSPSDTEANIPAPARNRTRVGRVERSRSPFGSMQSEDAVATEQRLNELRKRLTVVDDAIAELKANPTVRSSAANTFR